MRSIPSIGLMFVMTAASVAVAAPAPAGGAQKPGGGSGYSGGMGSDPLRFKQLTMDGIREKLAMGEEEWKGLDAKIEKVLDAQRNARTGAGMTMSSGTMVKGTPPPGVGGAPPQRLATRGGSSAGIATVDTPAGRAMQAIRAALDAASADAELLEKLATMRAARDAARAEVVAAQKELTDACTVRQQAVLVTLGILE